MELSSSTIGLLNTINKKPEIMVFVAAFGMPLFMFLFGMTIGRLYKKAAFASVLNVIIYSTLGVTWIVGFILMILLLFLQVAGIKLLVVLSTLMVFSLIFASVNSNAILKLVNESSFNIKK